MISITYYLLFIIFSISKITGACKGKNCDESELIYDLLQIFSLCTIVSLLGLKTEFVYILVVILLTCLLKVILKTLFGKQLKNVNEKIKLCKKNGNCFDPWKKNKKDGK